MRKSATTTTAAAAIALTVAGALIPAQAQAAPKVRFGAALDPTVQPSNSVPGLACDTMNPAAVCSFVMNEAYGRPDGGEKAPVSGRLKKIKVISGKAGTFRLQLVKARLSGGAWQAKVKADGPTITLTGQDQVNWDEDNYKVETFRVNLPIKKGWRLSMRAATTSAIRCSSGGDNTLLFQPPLLAGAGFRSATSDDGCWPLVEGVIRK